MKENIQVCLGCGRLQHDDSNFCSHCGARLQAEPAAVKKEPEFAEYVMETGRLIREQPEASSALAIGVGTGGVILGPLAVAAGKAGMIAGGVTTLVGALTESESLAKTGVFLLGGGAILSASGYLMTAAGGLSLAAGAGGAAACGVKRIRNRRASRKPGS